MPNYKNTLQNLFENNDKVLIRKTASKFKISLPYVVKIIQKKTNIKKRKQKKGYLTEIKIKKAMQNKKCGRLKKIFKTQSGY